MWTDRKRSFSTSRLLVGVAVCLMVNSLSACATQRLSFTMQAPANTNLKAKGVQSLAVSDFDGPGEAGQKVAEFFTAKLAEGQYFKVVEREKLLAMEKEQALGMTGVVDEKMAAKAGKLLGVDALVVGKVPAYSVKDGQYTRTVMQSRATGTYRTECNDEGKCYKVPNYEEVPVQEHHHIRNGVVTVSYRVIRAETGEVLVGRQETETYKYDTGNPPSAGFLLGSQRELGQEEVLTALAQNVVAKLATDVQPHQIRVDREFENGGWLFGDSAVKQGIEFVRANRLEDAIQRWEAVVKNDPQNSSAHYNLGLAYELAGNFEKAEQAYRVAEQISPEARYIHAVSTVKKSAEAQKKLETQTK
ncbi:MAG: tetratricopeptide repeat protein [Nitrospira sp.]|nr:tetratricopeptide repeat protein [Nitrospira sp.]